MDKDKDWMLMTYYCPTHGESGLLKPIQLTKKEISKTFSKKDGVLKINFQNASLDFVKRIKNFLIKN